MSMGTSLTASLTNQKVYSSRRVYRFFIKVQQSGKMDQIRKSHFKYEFACISMALVLL
jgi:hypothetical protein